MDIQKYYQQVRLTREELTKQIPSGFCLVMSVANLEKNSTAGNLCEVTVADAARLLTDGTHRLATPEEVDGHRSAQDKERARISAEAVDNARKQFSAVLGVSGAALGQPLTPPLAPSRK